ncbi:MAG: NUDIX domain-containing protein [Desulforhopalus sp.]
MSSTSQTGSAAVAIIRSSAPHDSFLILRRVTHPGDPWSGHFSFPGGRKEKEDQNLLATCIRETREETGIILHPHQLQQSLPLEPAGLNLRQPLWVEPFLFTIDNHPPLTLGRQEIQSALWVKSELFQKIELHQKIEMVPGRIFPAYPLDDYYLWGFTYRLLRAILQMDNS